MEYNLGKTEDLEVNKYRLVEQMINATIKNIVDAIVELITNSDDSYKKIKNKILNFGKIDIYITRDKKGYIKEIKVIDYAGGMNLEMLNKALTFAGITSGFYEGETVRGFFGRGLKEAGLKLGKTKIITIKDGKLSVAEFQWDKGEKKATKRVTSAMIEASDIFRKDCGILENNGTNVTITCYKDIMKCPDYKNIKSQIENHYALREINSAEDREIVLHFTSEGINKTESHNDIIKYIYPQGKELLNNEEIILPEYKDKIYVTLFESDIALERSYNNPFANSGLLVKTSSAILDNTLFKFSGENCSSYFFGSVTCEGIAKRLKENQDDGMIDPNRGGIEWKHRYCQNIQNEIEKLIEPYIDKKRKELEKDRPKSKISEKTKKIFDNLCSLLNKLAKEEIKETDLEGDESLTQFDKIKNLIIKPEKINLQINKERFVSVYMPLIELGLLRVTISSDNPLIQVLDTEVIMSSYPKFPTILRGRFRLIGRKIGEIGTITCKIVGYNATAEASVIPEKKPTTPIDRIKKPKGGIFTGIEANSDPDPNRRVDRDKDGKINVYMNFPSVKMYFPDGLLEPKTIDQKSMLAEFVGEAFCRYMARYLIENTGNYPIFPGDEITAVNRAMDDMQKKHLETIHNALT